MRLNYLILSGIPLTIASLVLDIVLTHHHNPLWHYDAANLADRADNSEFPSPTLLRKIRLYSLGVLALIFWPITLSYWFYYWSRGNTFMFYMMDYVDKKIDIFEAEIRQKVLRRRTRQFERLMRKAPRK